MLVNLGLAVKQLIIHFVKANTYFFCVFNLKGQTESKNHSKRSSGPETKGTAMSFGFKKKLLPSNKGKKSTVATNKTKEKDVDSYAQNETLASNSNSSILKLDNACCVGDKNGNIGKLIEINDTRVRTFHF